MMDSDDLSAKLRALPKAIAPERDLLPEIEARLRFTAHGTRKREGFPFRMVFAAAAVFVAGVFVGRMDVGRVRPSARTEMPPASSDFAAATELQRAGTAYVTALVRVVQHVGSSAVREQTRESATATLGSIVRQLDVLSDTTTTVTKF